MKTDYAGIDYGMGQSNVDADNGIRYGVISQHEVLQAWADSSLPYYPCEDCEMAENGEPKENGECDFCEPSSYYMDDDEYSAESDSYGDIFIAKSPYYTISQLCSPCAPGAGYIMNECENGVKSYCFGHDWFDNEKAPYTVYRVSDNSVVAFA